MTIGLQKIIRNIPRARFEYVYTFDKKLSKYFAAQRFFVEYPGLDISSVPDAVAVIPFLGNVLPIAWFEGFEVQVGELDAAFYESMLDFEKEFLQRWKRSRDRSSLTYSKLIDNNVSGEGSMLLFSGGVDSHATFFRKTEDIRLLATVHGADVPLAEEDQWKALTELIARASYLEKITRQNIHSNLRDFYTYHVRQLMPDYDWWGRVQHGPGLLCLLAPLSHIHQISRIYIASSDSERVDDKWGSSQKLDELIRWGGVRVSHDGTGVTRFEKTRQIVEHAHQHKQCVVLKVCYYRTITRANCCRCEKCCRTILAIILCGGNPNEFGFTVDHTIYQRMIAVLRGGFGSTFARHFWKEIGDEIKRTGGTDSFYVFGERDVERMRLNEIALMINANEQAGVKELGALTKWRYRLQMSFPLIHHQLSRWLNGKGKRR